MGTASRQQPPYYFLRYDGGECFRTGNSGTQVQTGVSPKTFMLRHSRAVPRPNLPTSTKHPNDLPASCHLSRVNPIAVATISFTCDQLVEITVGTRLPTLCKERGLSLPKSSIRQPLIISFTYDYANRRVGKRVQEKTGGQWRERYHHLYVYNGTQPVAEIDATTRRVLRTFAWGATGELLMIHDRTNTASPQTYLPVRDASGSVTALVRDDGNGTTIVAVYEYDPNGNLLRAQGEYAKKNPFTFGDGWMDWETGLVSAGSVYYSARLGRYINSGPSGAGDGLVAYYGVAPTVSCLPLRQYARPEALLRFADPGFTIDSPEWLAYEAALAAAEA
ncbi:RHS repeat-associated protein, partial [Ereboglobus sp. PH5-5]|nr:RHS repeat-associated protein [Ereboglobus sp. PH5-5]